MSSKGHLGLNLFEANLKRHPSVKGLFDEKGNKKSPVDSKNEVLLLNVDNKSEKESNDTSKNQDDELEEKIKDIDLDNEEEKDENKDNTFHKDNIKQISVTINRVQEKLVDNTASFFTELNGEEKKECLILLPYFFINDTSLKYLKKILYILFSQINHTTENIIPSMAKIYGDILNNVQNIDSSRKVVNLLGEQMNEYENILLKFCLDLIENEKNSNECIFNKNAGLFS